jgi:predicted site-specific integrase-resolvase
MWPMPIAEYVKMVGTHQAAADKLGVARVTVTVWLKRGRKIYVVPALETGVTYYEVREAA